MELTFIQSFGLLFLFIVAVSFIVKIFKQPIIIGYVLSGFFFSFLLAYLHLEGEQIIILSELGITFLLFLMGLQFDLKGLKHLGKDIFITTALQSIIFFAFTFILASVFGFGVLERIYISILFMFGSTLLVAKWLEDKKESATLHGKIILGTLIIQDIFAIITLTFLSVVQEKDWIKVIIAPVGGILLVLIAVLLAKYVLNHLLKFSSKYPELLFIFSLGMCFFFVEIAPILGYSTTIGAFIAGIMLANTIYKNEVSSRLKPLINFFNMLFFVGLGFQMQLDFGLKILLFTVCMVAMCMIIKPIFTYYTLRVMGYDKKTSFMSGLYLAQMSEFGIIIMAAGVFAGAVPKILSTIAIISVILTMILSSYFIKYDKKIYNKFQKYLKNIDKAVLSQHEEKGSEQLDIDAHILIFGYYELGKDMCSRLTNLGKKITVVENDPENIAMLKKEGISYVYNTASDPDFFENTNFQNTELVISNLIDIDTNKLLMKEMRKRLTGLNIIVTAKSLKESMDLYNLGADYVIYQSYLNEQQVSVLLEDYTTDIHKVITKKINDLSRFKEKEQKITSMHEEQGRFWDIDVFMKKLNSEKKNKKASEPQKPAAPAIDVVNEILNTNKPNQNTEINKDNFIKSTN